MRKSNSLNSEHFYKAGARLARTGGCSSDAIARVWCRDNRVTGYRRAKVLEGFGQERAQIMMAGSVAARSGRPFGRI